MRRQFFSTVRVVALTGLVAILAGSALQRAGAQILTIDDLDNNLGTVNITNGAVTVVGNMGGDTMTDIAYSPSGVLYGISFNDLYRINPSTAAVTLIGGLGSGAGGANALVFGTNGTLYMASFSTSDLFTVNITSGASTNIGNMGYESAGDLAFNGGSLYMSSSSNDLIRVDLQDGASGTDVGPFGFSDVYGLATADNGVLYGVAGTEIFSVDTNTGQGTAVLDYGGHGLVGAGGTSFITEAQSNPGTPEPGSLGLLTGLGLTGLGVLARRRRK